MTEAASAKNRSGRNLAILTTATLCNMTSYRTLEAMQSSLNVGVGVASLAVLYISAMLSSLLLTTAVISRFKCKRCLVFAAIGYTAYTAANFYPAIYTLLPAGLILGASTGIFWPAAIVYVINLAKLRSLKTKEDVEKVTAKYFGIFYGVTNFSIVFGTSFLAVLFSTTKSTGSSYHYDVTKLETTSNQIYSIAMSVNSTSALPLPHEDNQIKCGLNYDTSEGLIRTATLSVVVQYVMYSVFLVLNIIFALLNLCLDDLPNDIECKAISKNVQLPQERAPVNSNIDSNASNKAIDSCSDGSTYDTQLKTISQNVQLLQERAPMNSNIDSNASNKAIDSCSDGSTHDTQLKPISQNGNLLLERETEDIEANVITSNRETHEHKSNKTQRKSNILSNVKAVSMLIVTDKATLLLTPLTVHLGMVQAFSRGVYNGAWVSCTQGVEYAAYVSLCYGIFLAIGGICSGQIMKWMKHIPLFTLAIILEISVLVPLYVLDFQVANSSVLFILAGVLAFSDGMFKSQMPSAYNLIFQTNKSPAATIQSLWQTTGIATLYIITVATRPIIPLSIVLAIGALSYVLFIVGYKLRKKPYRYWKNRKPKHDRNMKKEILEGKFAEELA
ncbi:protein unc-93 homolog A-like [Clavelina lepadiformis]|uniref:protein unc-93 homolog A-like n=1 Tax=Clavelina lepadiformis TaxID=159417 RepID=UPI004042BEE2